MTRFGAMLVVALSLLGASGAVAQVETRRVLGIFYHGCDALCLGIQDRFEQGDFPIELEVRDLDQDMSLVPGLIDEARSGDFDLVITHGTSATLGVIGRLDDVGDPRFLDTLPVVFTQVADPFGTRIAAGFEGSGRAHVAGTFNRVPESVNIDVIRQYDPEFVRLGLLYNGNEENSVIKRDELIDLAPQRGVELVVLEIDPGQEGPPDPAMIPKRLDELAAAGVEWVYLGSSSFLRQNGELFTRAAADRGIAIVSPYEYLVREHDALLSVAARERDVGVLAAEQALRILRDGATPGDLPIVQANDFAYVVNLTVARKLDRIPTLAFLQVAETVTNWRER